MRNDRLLVPDGAFYNEPFTVCMPGNVDDAALERAFCEIIARRAILRTPSAATGVEWGPRIADPAPFRLGRVDLTTVPEEDREALAIEIAMRDLRATFALARGPRLRATLVRMSAAEQRLYVVMHHLVMAALPPAQLLGELYAATHGRGAPPAPAPAWQYADYAAWQAGGPALPAICWEQVLAGGPPWTRLSELACPPSPGHGGPGRRLQLPRDLVEHLRALGRRSEPTLFTTLLAAFGVLLSRYAGHGGVAIGTFAAGRGHLEIGQLLRRFVNLLPIRIHPLAPPSFRGLIAEVRRSLLEALDRDLGGDPGGAPGGDLGGDLGDARDASADRGVEATRPPRTPGAGPLFQVALTIEPAVADDGEAVAPCEPDPGAARLELSLELDERPLGILLSMRAATGRSSSWMFAQLVNVRSIAPVHRLEVDPESWRSRRDAGRVSARGSTVAPPAQQAGARQRRATRRRAGRRKAAGARASRCSRRGRIRPVPPAARW